MAVTLRLSEQGLQRVELARKKLNFSAQASIWYGTAHTSLATLKRFRERKPVAQEVFKRLCEVIGIMDWESLIDETLETVDSVDTKAAKIQSQSLPTNSNQIDASEFPDDIVFYGRVQELVTLERLILQEQSRLVIMTGLAGIGKTALTVQLTKKLEMDFAQVLWQDLRFSPTLNNTIKNCVNFFDKFDQANPEPSLDLLIYHLLGIFKKQRCLLIFDGLENISEAAEYKSYSDFLLKVAQISHQSCVIVTSQENLPGINFLSTKAVATLPLEGLGNDAHALLSEYNLADPQEWNNLIDRYRGNPLALKWVAIQINRFFVGSVSQFLNQGTDLGVIVPSIFKPLFRQQFEGLSLLEKQVMCVLAHTRHLMDVETLRDRIQPSPTLSDLIEALDALLGRSLIEETRSRFTLQPLVMKYILREYTQECGEQMGDSSQTQPLP